MIFQSGIDTLLLACTVITSISAVVAVFASIFKKVGAPNRSQNARLDVLEARTQGINTLLDNDNRRLNAIEDGNKVTQQAILALMGHAIDGNEIGHLREAKEKLQEYLINK